LVGARVVVPIHWGTLYPIGLEHVLPGPLRRPAEQFIRAVHDHAPGVEVRALAPGGETSFELPARAGA
jgi:hypothetical protein